MRKKIKNAVIKWIKGFSDNNNGELIAVSNHLESRKNFDINKPLNSNNKEEIYTWINEGISHFKEWYQPVDFGNGVIAHVTQPPYWQPNMELFYQNDVGITKWNYIIKKHLPNLKGKRVLDLGCSSGIFTIELARLGAKEVIGIDRNKLIRHKSTITPPCQDVISQAKFVKRALELLNNEKYPITYIAHDIGRINDLDLGKFDLIIALCVVYHELDDMHILIERLAKMTDYLILQANEGHGGDLAKYAKLSYHIDLLIQNGFTNLEIDAPKNYLHPVIICKK